MTLIAVRKYMSLDQIAAFETIYNTVINHQEPFSAAVAILEANDAKRSGSAGKKILDALNRKFETAYGQPLLTRSSDDTWSATSVGIEVYHFAKAVVERLELLEETLTPYLAYATPLSFCVRNTLTAEGARTLADLRESLKTTNVEIQRSLKTDETTASILADASVDILVDELFYQEKPTIDRAVFKYIQLPKRYICLAIPEGYRKSLPFISKRDEKWFVENKDIPHINILIVRQAFSIRAALELAGKRSSGNEWNNPNNLDVLSQAYKAPLFVGPALEDVAISLDISGAFAIIMSEDQIALLEDLSGMKFDRVFVTKNDEPQYYHPSVFIRRARLHDNSNGAHLSGFDKRLQNRGDRASGHGSIIRPSPIQRNYDNPRFECAHCGYQIEYEESDDAAVVVPCPSCLSVNSYEPLNGIATQLKSSRDVDYTDTIFDQVFHCISQECSAEFEPIIRTTLKGRKFIFCDTCQTIFQEQRGKQVVEKRQCPAENCGVIHTFRVSEAKPIDEISCYNSFRHITFNSLTDEVTASAEQFRPEVYHATEIRTNMAFPCPHFGCTDTRSRRVIQNKEQQSFARCRTCKTDIHIVVDPKPDS